MAVSWELLILFSALFGFIVILAHLGIWSIIEEGSKLGKLVGSFLVILSYALFMAISYCAVSGWMI